jgi:hypothetical protein
MRACSRGHAHARIGGAATHNRPRRIEARPSASAIVRAAGPEAAHTLDKSVTRAVFHAPMFALNAFASKNACEPNRTRSTPTGRAITIQSGCVCTQTHGTLAQTSTSAYLYHNNLSIHTSSHLSVHMYKGGHTHPRMMSPAASSAINKCVQGGDAATCTLMPPMYH